MEEDYSYVEDDDDNFGGSGGFYNISPVSLNQCDGWTEYFGATPVLDLTSNLLNGSIAIVCILGLVGNGRTIYLLAYSIKRNYFTTFILNLSIADCGVLTSFLIVAIFAAVLTLHKSTNLLFVLVFLFLELFFFSYSASRLLLTAISLDRCVAVLFPRWHRSHCPPYLPSLVCLLTWNLSFLLSAVHLILYQATNFGISLFFFQIIVNGLLCTPLMVVSTATLWIRLRSKPQRNQRKLLTALFLALLFFLLFSVPMDVSYVTEYFGSYNPLLMTIGMGCTTVNSSINPLLYFLVGKKKKGKDQPRAPLKVALQRIFKDEKGSPEYQKAMEETHC